MSVAEIEVHEIQLEAPTGLWREAWRRMIRNPGAIVGMVFIAVLIIAAVFAPLIAPHDPLAQGLNQGLLRAENPSRDYWFGLDRLGRDQFSRVVYGARYTLLIGLVAVGIGLSIGLAAMLGPGLTQVMIAVGVAQIPIFARLLRGSILAQLDNDFVLAARAVGVRRWSILFSHILPNSLSPVIVQATLVLATAIIDVAGLGFLGLGPQDPSTPEWGTMLTDSNEYLQVYPWLAIIPGMAIIISVLGFNLIGDGLREALDPKFRGRA
jgi:peptide/nickel transport system permease protein